MTGKALAQRLTPLLRGEDGANTCQNQSTTGLVARTRELDR